MKAMSGLSNVLGKQRSNNEDLATENQELRRERLQAREKLIQAENRLKARSNELIRLKQDQQIKKGSLHEMKVRDQINSEVAAFQGELETIIY